MVDVGGYPSGVGLAEEYEALRRHAQEVATACARENLADPRGQAARLGEEGLLGWLAPARHGGLLRDRPYDVTALCVIREALGTCHPALDTAFVSQALGGVPLLLAADDDLMRRYLAPAARGELLGALALTEPGAGSDLAGIETRAVPDGDGYVLDGEKRFITNGGVADFYVVCARTDPDGGTRGLTAFVVEAGTPGFEAVPRPMITPHPTADLFLQGCRVPRRNVVGAPGDGFKVAMRTLEVLRSSVGAFALGLAQRAFDLARERVRERRQFGQPLAEFQAIRFKLADMATRLRAARLMVYSAAAEKDRAAGVRSAAVTAAVSMAKLFATEAAFAVVNEAVQIFGGESMTRDHELERLYREVRPPLIYEGTSEIQRLIIAAALLDG